MQLLTQVAPATTTEQLHKLRITGIYTIKPSHALPRIQSKKTLKSVWLSTSGLKRFNRVVHRCRHILTASYIVFGTLSAIGAFFPLPIGSWIAMLSTPLALVPLLTTFLSLRYDMVVLLLATFEFWYSILVGTMGSLLLALYTRDGRAASAISVVVIILMGLLFDANFRAMRHYIIMSAAAGLGSFAYAVFVAFSWIQDVHQMTILRVYDRAVTAESVMTHSFVAAGIVELHNAYVRRALATSADRETHTKTSTVRCGVYRCRLRYRPSAALAPPTMIVHQHHIKRPALAAEEILQLKCSGVQHDIDATCTLFQFPGGAAVSTTWSWTVFRWQLVASAVIGFCGMAATFAAVAAGHDPATSKLVCVLGVASFVATLQISAFFVGFVYQVEVLRLLYTNFDFVFNFGQLTLAHLCLCDLSGWDARAFAVVASLLWLHWAAVVDAIPPIRRTQLRLHVHRLAAAIEITFLCLLAYFVLDLLDWHTQQFQNRQIGGSSRGNLDWSMGSFFLNRVAALVAWLGRSLYRLVSYHSDELVALRGVVEFDDGEVHRRRTRSRTQIASASD